jgi:hypothetical protein
VTRRVHPAMDRRRVMAQKSEITLINIGKS